MPVTERMAVDAARAFAAGRGGAGWREESVAVSRTTIAGEDCWLVSTDQAPAPGEPDWAWEIDGHVAYAVGVATGTCIGVVVGGTFHPAR